MEISGLTLLLLVILLLLLMVNLAVDQLIFEEPLLFVV